MAGEEGLEPPTFRFKVCRAAIAPLSQIGRACGCRSRFFGVKARDVSRYTNAPLTLYVLNSKNSVIAYHERTRDDNRNSD